MSVRTLYDSEEQKAVMYDSVTDTAFGPLFEDKEQVERFLRLVEEMHDKDVRRLTDAELRSAFVTMHDRIEEET